MKKMYWRKSKTLAMLNNRRQWLREFDPVDTPELEITTENGVYLLHLTIIERSKYAIH